MEKRKNAELAKLLDHEDQRVRLEAQWELADRGKDGAQALIEQLQQGPQLARLHAIWGIGQVIRHTPEPGPEATITADVTGLFHSLAVGTLLGGDKAEIGPKGKEAFGKILGEAITRKMLNLNYLGKVLLGSLLEDADAEIRAQAAKTLGECGKTSEPDTESWLLPVLADPNPRPRFFAAVALAKLGDENSIDPLIKMLRENADADPYLRHAAVMGLVGINKPELVLAKADDESSAVRMGILLALRRMQRPEIARFLKDRDPLLVVEAARAINDVPIEGAFLALAALAGKAQEFAGLSELKIDPNPLLLRILNANFRLGKTESAKAIAQVASLTQVPENSRLEALGELRDWAHPSGRDRVIGVWRPQTNTTELNEKDSREAVRPQITNLLKDANGKVAQAAAQIAGQYKIAESGPALFDLVSNTKQIAEARVEALRALGELNDPKLSKAIFMAQNDDKPSLRTEGNAQLARLDPNEAIRVLSHALEGGSAVEKQGALNALSEIKTAAADALIEKYVDQLLAGQAAPEMQLELLDVARTRSSDAIKRKVAKYESSISKDDPLGGWREALAGGQTARGEDIFFNKVDAQCQKCHTVKGKGGGEVGPELTTIGSQKTREYILTSIVHPNHEIAQGFENVTLTTDDGQEISGRVVSEDTEKMLLEIPEQEEGEEFIESAENPAAPLKTEATKPAKSDTKSTEAKAPKVTQMTLAKSKIKSRQHNLSSMPEDLVENLSKSELRDLVEYLSSLK